MESYESLVASGLTPIKPTPIVNGRVPPPSAPSMGRALVGTIPPELQLDADFAENQYGGQVPSYRLMPPASSGKSSVNATVVSGTTKIAETAVVALDPVTGNMHQGPLNKLPVAPRPVAPRRVTPVTLDNLNDGLIYARVNGSNLTANDVDLAKSGVQGKILDNIGDGSTYGRTLGAGLSGGYVHNMKDGTGSVRIIKGVGDASTLSLDTEIGDGTTYARYRASLMQNGVPTFAPVGKNLISNSGFEFNVGATPTNAPITAVGASVGDTWYLAQLDATFMAPELETGGIAAHSGENDLMIHGPTTGIVLPATSTTLCRVFTHFIPVRPGDVLFLSGWARQQQNIAYPSGVNVWTRLGLFIYDGSGTFITEQFQQFTNPSLYQELSLSFTVPANGVSVQVQCTAFTVNTNATAVTIPAGGSIGDSRFDDIALYVQVNLDNEILDGTTYQRTLATALTSGQIDFSKSGFQNKNLDNVGDGASFVRLASTHAAANVSYNFQGTWSSATAYVIADEVTFNNIYWIALANNTNSQPATSNINWQAVGRIQGDLQIFTSNGTWNKPAAGQFALITVIGGGGNGGTGFRGTSEFGGGGGGAGGVSKQLLPLSVLGATENVIVGTAGGASSFGSWLKATGGGNGGNATSGGVGSTGATGQGTESGQLTFVGGSGGVGGSGTGTGGTGTAGSSATPNGYAGGTGGVGSGIVAGAAGNPGTNSSANEPSGGGGGGGGGASSWNNAGGTGGVGGAGGNYGAGGGGGGGSFGAAAGVGGTGAAGIVVIACF